jgi:hypothetical protein
MSNTPPGTVLPLPKDPDMTAEHLRKRLKAECSVSVGVIIADSRTHAMRLGCSGVAIGCSGVVSVIDERGRKDSVQAGTACDATCGRGLHCISRRTGHGGSRRIGADGYHSRLALPTTDQIGVATIDASGCLFMGVALNTNPALFNNERKAE